METVKGIQAVEARTRKEWRQWLQKYHAKEKSVWLIMHNKNSVIQGISYEDAVEEALCFGWIDSVANKRDAQTFYLFFAQRKPKSVWSKPNKERVERLIAENKMTAPGLKMIDLAKSTGTWNALNDIDDLVVPPDLKKAFSRNKAAAKYFDSFPPSSKKIILTWIASAKKVETREKRISETIELAAKNIRANHPRPK